MTNEQFVNRFLTRMYATMPSLRKWVEDNSPNQPATHAAWYKSLIAVEFNDAVAVLDEIATGEFKIEAYDRDYIAIRIRDRASSIRRSAEPQFVLPTQADGRDPTYRCNQCRDTGGVLCVHTIEYKKVKDGKSLDEKFDTAMFRCNCPIGDRLDHLLEELRIKDKPKAWVKFNPGRYVAVQDGFLTEDQKAELKDICFPSNQVVSDFAAWS